MAESSIQWSILKWLETTGLLHWRANSGEVFVHGRRITLGPDGCPDVIVLVPPTGHFMGLEVKSAKGSVRSEQVAFAKRLNDCGASYYVVRTLDEARNAVAKEMGDQWKPTQAFGVKVLSTSTN